MRSALSDILGRSLSNLVLKTAQACAVDRSPAGLSHANRWACCSCLENALSFLFSENHLDVFVRILDCIPVSMKSNILHTRQCTKFWGVSRFALYLQCGLDAQSFRCLALSTVRQRGGRRTESEGERCRELQLSPRFNVITEMCAS